MANIIDQIKKKVKPGQHVYYMDKNNKLDNKTLVDLNNEFEKLISNQKNWHAILEAIYDEQNTAFVAAPKKGSKTEFSVINTKKTKDPAFDVKIEVKDNALIIKNLMDKKKTTIIETAKVMDSNKDTPTSEKQVERLQKNLKDYANKTPKELKAYLESIIKTL